MFVFKPTNKTYSDPVAATFAPGVPFGREKSRGDICLLHTGFSASKIYLNSKVLREAMLNSKDYLEEALNIRITDREGKGPKKLDLPEEEVEIYEAPVEFPELPKEEPVTEEVTIDASELNIAATDVVDGPVVEEVVIDAPEEVAEVIEEVKKTKKSKKK